MGMAFQEISVFQAAPVFQTLVAQGVVTAPEFGVKLATTGSELFLGGVDTALFQGDLTTNPVTQVVKKYFSSNGFAQQLAHDLVPASLHRVFGRLIFSRSMLTTKRQCQT